MSKTIARESVSGHWQHIDAADGSHSVNELNNRMADRQQAINDAIKKDWPKDMLSTTPESHPTLGNALSQLPKPSDVGKSSVEHYGVGKGTPEANPGTPSKAKRVPDSNAHVSK